MSSTSNIPIVVATSNRNKLFELKAVGERCGVILWSPEQARAALGLGPAPEVDETGNTFEENALLKARSFAAWSGHPALGDDSGLEVSALGGRPGIHSARYAGPGASDEQKIDKLLDEIRRELRLHPSLDRSAQFRCVLVLVSPTGEIVSKAEGTLSGLILEAPRGTKGFGYDPIVLIESLQATLAEVDFEIVCQQGFRAIAAERLFREISSDNEG